MYLGDLCGASHQVVDIVVELQLPLGRHFFDVSATEHHFVRETRDKRDKLQLLFYKIWCNAPQCYCTKVASQDHRGKVKWVKVGL